MNKNMLFSALIAESIVLTDQVTKWAVLLVDSPANITSFLSFELTFNRGISWGFFSSSSSWLFTGVSILVAVLTGILAVYAYHRYKKGLNIYPEAAIIAGSCSNLIDRLVHGGVVDFIVLHFQDYYWPVFNVADVAIVCGVIGLFLRQLKTSKQFPYW